MNQPQPTRPVEKRLELQKPVFFAGQYLSELDLQSIVTWADKRLRFGQHGQPWGIVEGLYVSALPSESSAARAEDRLSISPGWAFNARQDLCISDRAVEVALLSDESECGREIQARELSPWANMPEELAKIKIAQVIDLFVEPAEAETRYALGASVTGKKNCHPSRNAATIHIKGERVKLDCLDSQDPQFNPERKPEVQFLKSYSERFPQTPTLSDFKDWMKWQSRVHPETQRLWPTFVASLTDEMIKSRMADVLSWCCYSLRTTRKPGDVSGSRIPLARIWLTRVEGLRKVFWIDERAKYRKILAHSLPQFVCAEWIGAELDVAAAAARRLGVELMEAAWNPEIEQLKTVFADEPVSASATADNALQAFTQPLFKGGKPTIMAFAVKAPTS